MTRYGPSSRGPTAQRSSLPHIHQGADDGFQDLLVDGRPLYRRVAHAPRHLEHALNLHAVCGRHLSSRNGADLRKAHPMSRFWCPSARRADLDAILRRTRRTLRGTLDQLLAQPTSTRRRSAGADPRGRRGPAQCDQSTPTARPRIARSRDLAEPAAPAKAITPLNRIVGRSNAPFLIVPPSTRSAAPLVAEDSVPSRRKPPAPRPLRASQTAAQGRGPAVLKNSFFHDLWL